MLAYERDGVGRLTIGPAETFLGYISEVGTLVSADISTIRQSKLTIQHRPSD